MEPNHLPDLFLLRRNNMNFWCWQLSLSSSSSIKQLQPKIQTCREDKSFHKFGFIGCSVLSTTFVCCLYYVFFNQVQHIFILRAIPSTYHLVLELSIWAIQNKNKKFESLMLMENTQQASIVKLGDLKTCFYQYLMQWV